MYKKIFLDSAYIENVGEYNNYGADTVLELINKSVQSTTVKNISRIIFKATQFDENTKTILTEELFNNDAELYLVLYPIHVKIHEKILTKLNIHPLLTSWINSFGDVNTKCNEGACWDNNGITNAHWNGGAYDANKTISYHILDIKNIELNKSLEFKYDDLLSNDFITLEDLFDNGLILKFEHTAENSPADYFNMYFDKTQCYIIAKYNNSSYDITEDKDTLLDIRKPCYISDNIKEYYHSNYTKHHTITINVNVHQINEKKSYFITESELNYILPQSTSYSITDLTTQTVIIPEDFYYNTINLINGEMFFELDLSFFTKNHSYKITYFIKDEKSNTVTQLNNYKFFKII